MKRPVAAAALFAVAMPAGAGAQTGIPLQAVIGVDGNCTSLIVEGKAVACLGVALNMVYAGQHSSIMFRSPDGLISFFGTLDGKGGITVTKVTIGHEGPPTQTRSVAATGRCTAESLREPGTHVECSADTSDGQHYAASFTSTGTPTITGG